MNLVRNSLQIPTVTIPPTSELITVAQMKEWLRMDYSTDDTLIGGLITTARVYAESYLSSSIGEQTVEVVFTHDGCKEIKLPRGPVTDSTPKVEYKSCPRRDWTDITLETDSYHVEGAHFLGLCAGYYRVTYDCGYDSVTIPQGLLDGIKMLVARLYEHRGDETKFTLGNDDLSILNPYANRVWL